MNKAKDFAESVIEIITVVGIIVIVISRRSACAKIGMPVCNNDILACIVNSKAR